MTLAAVPSSAPEPSAIEQATREARERLASGTPITEAIRRGDGTFTGKSREGDPPAAADPAPEPQPQAEGAAPESGLDAGAPPAAEGGEAPTPEAAAAAGGAGEAEGEGEAEGTALAVELPGRRPEDPPFVIDAPDQETAERLRQLTNGYMRGEEARAVQAEASRALEDREELMDLLTVDPGGFVLENIRDARTQVSLARQLLANPVVWQALQRDVLALDDPSAYRTFAAEAVVERHRETSERQAMVQEQREARRNYNEIKATLGGIVEHLPANLRDVAQYDMLRDLKAYSERYDLLTIPVADIPAILAPRLRALGVDPATVAGKPATESRGAGEPPAAPGRKTVQRKAGTQPTGAQLVAASGRKKAAGAIPGAGAGAPGAVAGNRPPPREDGTPMGIQETIEWHRRQRSVSGGLYSRRD